MNLSLDIARRYLFGKKTTNAINIISWISVSGVAIGTAALVLILSVFNGFEGIISNLFNSFNPDMVITPAQGKDFEDDPELLENIASIEGVIIVSRTLDDIVLYQYNDIQEVGLIKGVDSNFNKVTSIDSTIRRGQFVLQNNSVNYGVAGIGLANKLGLNIDDGFTPIITYIPRLSSGSPFAKDYNSQVMYPAATFSVQTEDDYQSMITNLEFVQKLREEQNNIGAYELKLDPEVKEKKIRKELETLLGEQFVIKNRFEQDEAFLKLMNIEKWVSFALAGFAFVLIAFNLVGSLWMIVLDKKQDISILKSMGFTDHNVQSLFVLEGLLICGLGIFIGLVLAIILYLLQLYVGIVRIGEGFIIETYPVKMFFSDVIIVSATVLSIGFLASLPGAIRAKRIKSYVREE